MSKAIRVMAVAFSISCMGVLAACGGGAAESATPTNAAATTSGDQVSAGAKLYAANCASCHGANGEGGGQIPAVVGKGALPLDAAPGVDRKAKFHTAADVFKYVKANMPPDKPGSLTDEQYAAILAFDLKANGVDVTGKKVDATTAQSFVLHP